MELKPELIENVEKLLKAYEQHGLSFHLEYHDGFWFASFNSFIMDDGHITCVSPILNVAVRDICTRIHTVAWFAADEK